MKLLDAIVKEMLEKHVGGTEFFDNLDKSVQNDLVVERLITMFNSRENYGLNIICSGKFGKFLLNYLSATRLNGDNCITTLVKGGLRKGDQIDDLSYIKDLIVGNSFIFIDDSFYSGKTRDAVAFELRRHGGNLVKTYVVYDGSQEKDSEVESLYRYYADEPKPCYDDSYCYLKHPCEECHEYVSEILGEGCTKCPDCGRHYVPRLSNNLCPKCGKGV